jgi:sugar phosphate isomerase/epimerase
MRFLFSTGSLYTYGLDRCFELAGRAGFDGMEVVVDQRWDTRHASYLAGLVERFGLPILALHAPFDAFALPGWPDKAPDRIAATVKLAEEVGAKVVVHHLPLRWRIGRFQRRGIRIAVPLPGENDYMRWLQHDYQALQACTEVLLCIENLPAIRIRGRRLNMAAWNNAAEMARFRHVTMDTTHLGTWGTDPLRYYEGASGRVRHVHLSNFDGREHRRPEGGYLRLDRLLSRLVASGYDGAVTLELHPDALEAGAPDARVQALMAGSLAYCRAMAAGPETT